MKNLKLKFTYLPLEFIGHQAFEIFAAVGYTYFPISSKVTSKTST